MPENMAWDCRVLRSLGRNSRASGGGGELAPAQKGAERPGVKREKTKASRSLALPAAEAGLLAACKTDFSVEKSGICRYMGQMCVIGSLKMIQCKM